MSARNTDKPEAEAFELPDTTDLKAVDAAEIVIIQLAAQRRISSREALDFTHMLDHRRRAIADVALEQRMDRIELQRKLARGNGK